MSEAGDRPPRSFLIAALVVAVGAVAAVLVVATILQRPTERNPVVIASAPAPQGDGPQCRALNEVLPEQLGEYSRAPVMEPAPAGTAAWQAEDGGEALILRCGLDRPLEFVAGAPIQVVDAVQWFKVADATSEGRGTARERRSTWFAVDRPVYVALTLPAGSGPTPIQAISTAIATALPAQPADPAPIS